MNRLYIAALVVLMGCGDAENTPETPEETTPPSVITGVKQLSFSVISRIPHDTGSYTQGLEIVDGKIYEGTGDYEQSALQICDRKTGAILQKQVMGSSSIFGEGITVFKNNLYQLTWTSNKVFVYDKKDITKPIKTLSWPYEGWGITHDSAHLYVSDGTANIHVVDPETFRVLNTFSVRDEFGPVDNLNELEYVKGSIFANIYTKNTIVQIDPVSGNVIGRMQLDNLLQPNEIIPERTDVLNGIAYDSSSNTFIITGKRWPAYFELRLQ
jgi:glutamine cyclotransferase